MITPKKAVLKPQIRTRTNSEANLEKRLNRDKSQERISAKAKDRDEQTLNTDLSGIMLEESLTASRSVRGTLEAKTEHNRSAAPCNGGGTQIAIKYAVGMQGEGYLATVQKLDQSSASHTNHGSMPSLAPMLN